MSNLYVSTLDAGLFGHLVSLESLEMNWGNLTVLPRNAYQNKENLTSLILNDDLHRLASNSDYYCLEQSITFCANDTSNPNLAVNGKVNLKFEVSTAPTSAPTTPTSSPTAPTTAPTSSTSAYDTTNLSNGPDLAYVTSFSSDVDNFLVATSSGEDFSNVVSTMEGGAFASFTETLSLENDIDEDVAFSVAEAFENLAAGLANSPLENEIITIKSSTSTVQVIKSPQIEVGTPLKLETEQVIHTECCKICAIRQSNIKPTHATCLLTRTHPLTRYIIHRVQQV